MNWKEIVLVILVVVLISVGLSALLAVFVKFLLNVLVLPLFGVATKLTFLQTWGIMFVLSLIGSYFKSRTTIEQKRW